jgi:hypothetical protein
MARLYIRFGHNHILRHSFRFIPHYYPAVSSLWQRPLHEQNTSAPAIRPKLSTLQRTQRWGSNIFAPIRSLIALVPCIPPLTLAHIFRCLSLLPWRWRYKSAQKMQVTMDSYRQEKLRFRDIHYASIISWYKHRKSPGNWVSSHQFQHFSTDASSVAKLNFEREQGMIRQNNLSTNRFRFRPISTAAAIVYSLLTSNGKHWQKRKQLTGTARRATLNFSPTGAAAPFVSTANRTQTLPPLYNPFLLIIKQKSLFLRHYTALLFFLILPKRSYFA